MFRLRDLVEKHTEEIARAITTEQGKTLVDARGDVFRGLGTCSCLGDGDGDGEQGQRASAAPRCHV